jgi:hypothetical protein
MSVEVDEQITAHYTSSLLLSFQRAASSVKERASGSPISQTPYFGYSSEGMFVERDYTRAVLTSGYSYIRIFLRSRCDADDAHPRLRAIHPLAPTRYACVSARE